MRQILLVQVDRETVDLLRHHLSKLDVAVENVPALEDGLTWVTADGVTVDALVLGPGVEEPVRAAQRLYQASPALPIVILSDPAHHQHLLQALQFTPFLGENVTSHAAGDPTALAEMLEETISRNRQRETFRATLAVLNERLATTMPHQAQATQYLDRLLTHAPIGVALVDRRGTIVAVNRMASEIFDVSEREALGTPLTRLFPQSEQARLAAIMGGGSTTSQRSPSEVFTRTSMEGQQQFIEFRSSPLPLRTGEPGSLIILQDVTRRTTAEQEREEALRLRDQLLTLEQAARATAEAAEWRFRDLVNTLDAIVWEGDPETLGFTFVSQRAEGILGYRLDRWLREPDFWVNLIHPDDRERIVDASRVAIAAGQDHDLEYRVVAADGRVVWLHDTVHVVRDDQDRPVQLRGLMVDITDRKRTEERQHFLAQASRLLSGSLEYSTTLRNVLRLAVPDLADFCAVDVVEEDGSIRRLAEAHVDSARERAARELRARYPIRLDDPHPVAKIFRTGEPEFHPEADESLLWSIARDDPHAQGLREIGLKSYMSVPLVTRSRILGAITFVRGSLERRYSQDDLILAEDVAQRAALALDNAQLYQDAQRAIQLRDEFLSIASHELKTPLTVLKGYVQLLDRLLNLPTWKPDRLLALKDRLGGQVDRLEVLVSDLLDASRVQQGRLELRPECMDLVALARQVLEWFEGVPERKPEHELILEAPESVTGVWDPDRLSQVLTNLVSNALKYSPNGGEVRITIDRLDDAVQLMVSDRGIGIAPAEQERLFQPFMRGEDVRQEMTGTGLGLYISCHIVQRHGGTIDVESTPGEGTTFTIHLPLTSENPESARSSAITSNPAEPPAQLKP